MVVDRSLPYEELIDLLDSLRSIQLLLSLAKIELRPNEL